MTDRHFLSAHADADRAAQGATVIELRRAQLAAAIRASDIVPDVDFLDGVRPVVRHACLWPARSGLWKTGAIAPLRDFSGHVGVVAACDEDDV